MNKKSVEYLVENVRITCSQSCITLKQADNSITLTGQKADLLYILLESKIHGESCLSHKQIRDFIGWEPSDDNSATYNERQGIMKLNKTLIPFSLSIESLRNAGYYLKQNITIIASSEKSHTAPEQNLESNRQTPPRLSSRRPAR